MSNARGCPLRQPKATQSTTSEFSPASTTPVTARRSSAKQTPCMSRETSPTNAGISLKRSTTMTTPLAHPGTHKDQRAPRWRIPDPRSTRRATCRMMPSFQIVFSHPRQRRAARDTMPRRRVRPGAQSISTRKQIDRSKRPGAAADWDGPPFAQRAPSTAIMSAMKPAPPGSTAEPTPWVPTRGSNSSMGSTIRAEGARADPSACTTAN